MRARNIKPGFWRNEELVELPFQTRLLFIGLWNLADNEGRLENRPKKIKLEIFPADDVDISLEITRLSEAGLVKVYEVEGKRCICVINFKKHQNPHHREAKSELPPPPAETEKATEKQPQVTDNKGASERHVQAQGKPEESRADSGSLIPDSSNNPPVSPQGEIIPNPEIPSSPKPTPKRKRKTQIPDDFALTDERRSKAVAYWQHRNRLDLDPETEFDRFVTNHQAKGSTMADWDAAWKTWYVNAIKFTRPNLNVIPGGSGHETHQRPDNSAAGRVRENIRREQEQWRLQGPDG